MTAPAIQPHSRTTGAASAHTHSRARILTTFPGAPSLRRNWPATLGVAFLIRPVGVREGWMTSSFKTASKCPRMVWSVTEQLLRSREEMRDSEKLAVGMFEPYEPAGRAVNLVTTKAGKPDSTPVCPRSETGLSPCRAVGAPICKSGGSK